jgi:hypothetical protein
MKGVRDDPFFCTMIHGPAMADHVKTSAPVVVPADRKTIIYMSLELIEEAIMIILFW